MTDTSVIEGNEIIASFMEGYKRDMGHGDMIWDHASYMSPLVCKYPSELEYHSNWQWLMPVVEEISRIELERKTDEDTGETVIWTHHPLTFGMLSAAGRPMVRLYAGPLFEADTLIQATYEAVIDFVKWHNSQKEVHHG